MSGSVQELIDVAMNSTRELRPNELQRVLEHIATVGFDPHALERVRGRLAGVHWQGIVLTGTDVLPPATVHYLWHVVIRREWPAGTTLEEYVDSLRDVVLDPASGVVAFKYQGAPQLGVLRESHDLRGPMGGEWVLIQYRVSIGHLVTAFQPVRGLEIVTEPQWTDVRWLRRPTRSNAPQAR
jgi:hypothetical protein